MSPGLTCLVLRAYEACEVCGVVHRHQVRGVRDHQELARCLLDAGTQSALPCGVQCHCWLIQDYEPVPGLGQGLSYNQGFPGSCSMHLDRQVIRVRAAIGDPVDDHCHACRRVPLLGLLVGRASAEDGDLAGFDGQWVQWHQHGCLELMSKARPGARAVKTAWMAWNRSRWAGVPFFSSNNRKGSCHGAWLRSGETSASHE